MAACGALCVALLDDDVLGPFVDDEGGDAGQGPLYAVQCAFGRLAERLKALVGPTAADNDDVIRRAFCALQSVGKAWLDQVWAIPPKPAHVLKAAVLAVTEALPRDVLVGLAAAGTAPALWPMMRSFLYTGLGGDQGAMWIARFVCVFCDMKSYPAFAAPVYDCVAVVGMLTAVTSKPLESHRECCPVLQEYMGRAAQALIQWMNTALSTAQPGEGEQQPIVHVDVHVSQGVQCEGYLCNASSQVRTMTQMLATKPMNSVRKCLMEYVMDILWWVVGEDEWSCLAYGPWIHDMATCALQLLGTAGGTGDAFDWSVQALYALCLVVLPLTAREPATTWSSVPTALVAVMDVSATNRDGTPSCDIGFTSDRRQQLCALHHSLVMDALVEGGRAVEGQRLLWAQRVKWALGSFVRLAFFLTTPRQVPFVAPLVGTLQAVASCPWLRSGGPAVVAATAAALMDAFSALSWEVLWEQADLVQATGTCMEDCWIAALEVLPMAEFLDVLLPSVQEWGRPARRLPRLLGAVMSAMDDHGSAASVLSSFLAAMDHDDHDDGEVLYAVKSRADTWLTGDVATGLIRVPCLIGRQGLALMALVHAAERHDSSEDVARLAALYMDRVTLTFTCNDEACTCSKVHSEGQSVELKCSMLSTCLWQLTYLASSDRKRTRLRILQCTRLKLALWQAFRNYMTCAALTVRGLDSRWLQETAQDAALEVRLMDDGDTHMHVALSALVETCVSGFITAVGASTPFRPACLRILDAVKHGLRHVSEHSLQLLVASRVDNLAEGVNMVRWNALVDEGVEVMAHRSRRWSANRRAWIGATWRGQQVTTQKQLELEREREHNPVDRKKRRTKVTGACGP